MFYKQVTIFISALVCLFTLTSSKRQITIFIIGDSTAANKSNYATNPERGWGMMLQGCFSEAIRVDNHAVNGRSSKSFINEGRWDKVLASITPGDYVLIQFGHNDEKPNPERHTEPGGSFDDNLRRFVRDTRSRGGIPVLLNSVVRRNFFNQQVKNEDDELLRQTIYNGEEVVNSDTLVDTHGAYLESPRRVAAEERCVFIDANKITHDIEQQLGVIGSRRLHMWLKPGEVASIPKGRKDNTHYNVEGAYIVAQAIAHAVATKVPTLNRYLRHYNYVVSQQGKGNYMELQQAVEAASNVPKARILVLDGTWPKPHFTGKYHPHIDKYHGVVIR